MESGNTSPLKKKNGVQIQTATSRSDNNNNPYPTTFVEADTCSFKQVVQMLTGSSSTDPNSRNFSIPPIKSSPKRQQQNSFKLYERRNSNASLIINTLVPNYGNINNSPRRDQLILSPSMLDFPKLTLSPVTPLNEDTFSPSEEERAIAEKGFYLHPSPISTPRDSEPQLLSLFPLTSPTKLSPS